MYYQYCFFDKNKDEKTNKDKRIGSVKMGEF